MLKRCLDLAAAATGLLLLWPLIAACILVARLDTGESGLFAQRRVGRKARPFTVRKIRTMRTANAHPHGTVTVALDPRISRSGRTMRRWKLDELPQLWNVLVGEMSLVGPRPDVPGYADRLQGEERAILSLRPGITGPATIKYRDEERLLAAQDNPVDYNDSVIYPDKVRLNLEYLRSWSLSRDIEYILVTLGLASVPSRLLPSAERQPDHA